MCVCAMCCDLFLFVFFSLPTGGSVIYFFKFLHHAAIFSCSCCCCDLLVAAIKKCHPNKSLDSILNALLSKFEPVCIYSLSHGNRLFCFISFGFERHLSICASNCLFFFRKEKYNNNQQLGNLRVPTNHVAARCFLVPFSDNWLEHVQFYECGKKAKIILTIISLWFVFLQRITTDRTERKT